MTMRSNSGRRATRGAVAVLLAAGGFAVVAGATAGASGGPAQDLPVTLAGSYGGPVEVVADAGPLPIDAAALAAAKARANAASGVTTGAEGAEGSREAAPVVTLGWAGLSDPNSSPPDSTGAIGTSRYIEPVNRKFAIYDRTGALLDDGPLSEIYGQPAGTNVFDPQVIWDPTTKRFYLTGDVRPTATSNFLAYVYSKNANPTTSADFCKYQLGYGTLFPDFPKLGDTKDFVLIGSNVFSTSTNAFVRSDVVALTKPPKGTACQDPATIGVTLAAGLTQPGGALAFTPVPGNQIDPSSTGWIVGRTNGVPSSQLVLWKVTRNTNGTANIPLAGTGLAVPQYSIPSDAPQPGTARILDTSDTRPTQAILAKDPSQGGKFALWTQHTVAGGAGAEVRWYEINPPRATLFDSGVASSNSLHYFNGAVSSDRQVNGSTRRFGDTMVLQFSASSSSVNPQIRAVSRVAGSAQSGTRTVKSGPNILNDFSCGARGIPNLCRWGDYAGLTPDPVIPAAATRGAVWGTNELGIGSTWQNWNFALQP